MQAGLSAALSLPLSSTPASRSASTQPALSTTLAQGEKEGAALTSSNLLPESMLRQGAHTPLSPETAGAPAYQDRKRSDSVSSQASLQARLNARQDLASRLASIAKHGYTPSISSTASQASDIDPPRTPPTTVHRAPTAQAVVPIPRFLDCEAEDLKLGEVALLLADYKRLAAALGSK